MTALLPRREAAVARAPTSLTEGKQTVAGALASPAESGAEWSYCSFQETAVANVALVAHVVTAEAGHLMAPDPAEFR